ncbi:MAG: FtsW/RodA/SpoVE family cell cycle protein, partial [Phycisphaerales bacterium]
FALAAALGLSLLGVYAIDIATYAEAGRLSTHPRTLQQLIFLGAGVFAALLVTKPHPHFVRLLAWPALAVVVGLLLFLLVPFVPASIVRPRNGCRGWIDLGPFDLQPSELAKVAFVLAAAEYLRYRENHRTIPGLIAPALITMVPVGLVMLQPDLGMAMLFIPGIFAILLAAGAKRRHLLMVVLAGVLALPMAYPLLKPYQKERIVGLWRQIRGQADLKANPELFQAQTAQMVAGAGETFGLGEPMTRAVLRYTQLPERHNDMVFSVIMARFGLAGGLAVLGLYALWFISALRCAAACKDGFGRLVIVGFVAIIGAQVFINVGMNIGLVPIIGITLPFVSYGGSSMITVWVMTGLVFSIASRRPPRLARPTFEFEG